MEIKTCIYCNKKFETSAADQKYCSKECLKKFHKEEYERKYQKSYERTCSYCNNKFETNHSSKIYCSKECRLAHYSSTLDRKTYNKTCIICSKEFETNIHNKKCCSKECSQKHYLSSKPINKKWSKVCAVCGKRFETNKPTQKYCNKECKKIYYKKTIHNCKEKHKVINKKYNRIRTIVRDKVSYIINNSFNNNSFNGQDINYWNFKFPQNIKDKVLKRDEYECQVCGCKANLHIHHMTPRQFGGEHNENNLITLCAKCHKYIETNSMEYAVNQCTKNAIRVYNGLDTIEQQKITIQEERLKTQILIENIFDKLKKINNNEVVKEVLCLINDYNE